MTSVRATQDPPGPAVAGFNTYTGVRPAPLSCLKLWEGPERNRSGRMQQELGSTRNKRLTWPVPGPGPASVQLQVGRAEGPRAGGPAVVKQHRPSIGRPLPLKGLCEHPTPSGVGLGLHILSPCASCPPVHPVCPFLRPVVAWGASRAKGVSSTAQSMDRV